MLMRTGSTVEPTHSLWDAVRPAIADGGRVATLGDTVSVERALLGGPTVVIWEGSARPQPDAAIHDTFCALARALAADSSVAFRYAVEGAAPPDGLPFVLCIDPAHLADYLGVRGFSLVSDAAEAGPYRVAVARRRADRKSCCGLPRATGG
jgi:hypothetical protein